MWCVCGVKVTSAEQPKPPTYHLRKIERMRRVEYIAAVREYGQDILQSDGMQQSKRFVQHGTTSIYEHCFSVACACVMLARKANLQVNERSLVRGALLHDYFLYDWHDRQTSRPQHATKHGTYALENARRDFVVDAVQADMISKHMFPITLQVPSHTETWVLVLADKVVSLQETLQGIAAHFRNLTRRI